MSLSVRFPDDLVGGLIETGTFKKFPGASQPSLFKTFPLFSMTLERYLDLPLVLPVSESGD